MSRIRQEPDRDVADALVERSLALGERFAGGGNRPVRLTVPDCLWVVVRGAVDVFAARLGDDCAIAELKHLLRAEPGQVLFPAGETEGAGMLVAKGLPDSELCRVSRDSLAEAGVAGELVERADAWVAGVSAAVARDVTFHPLVSLHLAADAQEDAVANEILSTRSGVAWLSSDEGSLAYLGLEEPDRNGSGLVPVTPETWVSAARAAPVRALGTGELLREGRLFAALAEFNRLALSSNDVNQVLLSADVWNLQVASARYRQESEESARQGLLGVLGRRRTREEDRSGLFAVLERIGRYEGIRFRIPPQLKSPNDGPTLAAVLNASGVRSRRVSLGAGQRWWLNDSGAMLGFRREDNAPVALIPGLSGRYRMTGPDSAGSRPVNRRLADGLARTAVFFYPSVPDDPPDEVRALMRVAFRRSTGDTARLLLAGMLAGFGLLAPAVLLGVFVEEALPSGSMQVLGALTLLMVLAGLVHAFLKMIEGTASMRLEARTASRISAALWDRILKLPSRFFRNTTAGELMHRTMAFFVLRDQLSGIVSGSFLSVVFLLPTFALLFLYDFALGVLGLCMGMVSLLLTAIIGVRQLPLHRRRLAITRRLSGMLMQMISGIGKLRATGSEGGAFAMWARAYREQKQVEVVLNVLNAHLVAFTTAAPLFAAAALFAAGLRDDTLGTGAFLAVYFAFMVFYSAVTQLGFSFSAIAAVLPAVEQVSPILKQRPRSSAAPAASPELRGELLLDNVSFRYVEGGPLTLREITIHAGPGEFIAIVGESGAGKSTLFQLALGLETPLSGAVYYDGHDLARLSRSTLRNGVGMVVQDSSLRHQTILDNIIGVDGDLTEKDAWRAARLASVHDDIAAMPMGMYTVTSGISSVLSGGQAQRIMLAAALVRSPRVLLLDEATNWLDNETQARVMAQIENAAMTRVVSAHRLSTVRRADRIYVLRQGRIIQQGAFRELMEQEGAFREMALRQLA